jgi:hypothetical protein
MAPGSTKNMSQPTSAILAHGKDQLVALLRRVGVRLSGSMVGRILARLRHPGELHEPASRHISVRRRRWSRPYAVRRPADHALARPGDLVELDTLDGRPPGTSRPFKGVHRP